MNADRNPTILLQIINLRNKKFLKMTHESRLTADLRRLLTGCRRAALGTLGEDGGPQVSITPFAIDPHTPCVVLLVSGLAAHTANMRRDPRVSLLVAEQEVEGEPVHALGRITVAGEARVAIPDSSGFLALQQAYLRRFPEAEAIAQLPDFRYVAVYVRAVRQVAGFGAARDVPPETFERLLRSL